ncbi:MAG: phosphomannomutase/phosphoglucomutase [Clostridia bacterium]|nr:phosphomannomutase/phosphoglucomutase [Clostridia bacterium]
MEEKSYKSLKSGSDIRGIAVQTENGEVTLTLEAIYDITRAFVKWLSVRTGKTALKIAVGKDVRISGDAIYAGVQKALTESGCTLIYCGVSSTPSMYMLLKDSAWECDGSVMITASHLPFDRNGLKFFIPEGGLGGKDIDEIIELAEKGEALPKVLGGVVEQSYMDDYCRKLVNMVRTGTGKSAPLFGKRVIVDAGNGVGGFFVKKVLQQLGAITDGSINVEPDGNFPNHAPNPEDPAAIAALSAAVISSRAELGIIFDTDVDRAAVVDSNGKHINRDNLIALTAAMLLAEKPATIVTDSVTTDGLTEFIESLGGKHVRFKRGYKNVIDEAKRRNAHGEYCPLAIETSGHAAFADNYFLDDGAYLVCKLLIAYSAQTLKKEKLSDLIKDLKVPVEQDEVRVRFNVHSENYKREGERVLAELKYFAEKDKRWSLAPDCYEGVRINFADGEGGGWALIRMSVHDPVMPINFASREKGGNKKMAKSIYYLLEKYPFLFAGTLKKFVEEKKS